MALFDNLLTIGILLSLLIIIYCKYTNKTLPEIIMEFKEVFSEEEEVIVPG